MDIKIFANVPLINENGQITNPSELWAEKTAVFVFLRHFACIACRAHAKQIWQQKDTFEKNGSQIYFIGNGKPHFIIQFKDELDMSDSITFTDPTLEAFNAFGFKRGFLASLGPSALINTIKLKAAGHDGAKYEQGMGDLWQLGGIVVVNTSGEITYKYISEVLGDFPPEKDYNEMK